MTTDKLSAAMWDELAEAHAEAGHEYDAITRACRRRGDESARREGVERREWRNEQTDKMLAETLGEPTPAPADERAELVRRLNRDVFYTSVGAAETAATLLERDGARIAELERERGAARSRADRRFEEYVKQGEELRAANARAEAAEAEVARLREAAKAYRQAEQDYVFMAERPDEEYVPADVHLARMHMHRAAAALDAALAQKEPSNG
jgi:hypothetical protein